MRQTLLAGRLSLEGTVKPFPDRPLEVAVRFVCDLLTAATICEVLRGYDRSAGDAPTRVYVRSDGESEWRKVPGDARLTRKVGDRTVLDPSVFPPVSDGTVVELAAKPVVL